MIPSDLVFCSVAELSSLIKTKAVSPTEVCTAYLHRIKSVDQTLRCYITVLEEETLKSAKKAELQITEGRHRGPLHGIPIGIKDNLTTDGIRTTAGTKLLSEWIPRDDSAAVERLKLAGAIIIGKLNMHELACGGTTINPHFGTTRNPWNLSYTPGGSSGGSGAAVAAGLCAAALGTDGAGSVRFPAASCGVVGLKPTFGRVSRYGQVAFQPSLDHVGPLTRTVEDAAIVLQALAGHDPRDPASSQAPVPDYSANLNASIKGLRLGIPSEPFTQVSREVDETVQQAVTILERLGMVVEQVSLPHAKVDYTFAIESPIMMAEALATQLRDLLRYYKGSFRDLGPDLAARYARARRMPASLYVDAQKARQVVVSEFDEALRKVDVIVTPTKAVSGQTIAEGEARVVTMDGRVVKDRPMGLAFGIVYNITGLPAITLPCGFSKAGLPIGLQIGGRQLEEETVLRVAQAYEQATGWHKLRPPLL